MVSVSVLPPGNAGLMLTSMEEKGNVVGFGLPASIEIIPGIFSSGNNPRTERFKPSAGHPRTLRRGLH